MEQTPDWMCNYNLCLEGKKLSIVLADIKCLCACQTSGTAYSGCLKWDHFLWLIQSTPGRDLREERFLGWGPRIQPAGSHLTACQQHLNTGPAPWLGYQGKMPQLRTGKWAGSYQAKCAGRATSPLEEQPGWTEQDTWSPVCVFEELWKKPVWMVLREQGKKWHEDETGEKSKLSDS